jgi:hypothetical protein
MTRRLMMKKLVSVLLFSALVAQSYAATIVLTDLPARVFQRVINGTTADIALSGTYTGTAPVTIQARVVRSGTTTEVMTWTTLTNATISTGAWSGTLAFVPQGGWYNVQVRENPSTDVYADGSHAWGVGIVIAIWGQSNSLWLTESSSGGLDWGGADYVANPLLRQYGGRGCTCSGLCDRNVPDVGSWVNPTCDGDVCLGNDLVDSLHIPIAFHSWNMSGSVLLAKNAGCACGNWYWLGSQYPLAKESLKSITGTAEFVVWWQGYSDGSCGVSQSDYYNGLKELHDSITTGFPGSKLLLVVNDAVVTNNVKAALNQAVSTGYGYSGADAGDIPYVYNPDIKGLGAGDTVGHRLARSVLSLLADQPTRIDQSRSQPTQQANHIDFSLNPDRKQATLRCLARGLSPIEVTVFSATGKRVACFSHLVSVPGMQRVIWDERDSRGVTVASGLYSCQVVVDGKSRTGRIVLR